MNPTMRPIQDMEEDLPMSEQPFSGKNFMTSDQMNFQGMPLHKKNSKLCFPLDFRELQNSKLFAEAQTLHVQNEILGSSTSIFSGKCHGKL